MHDLGTHVCKTVYEGVHMSNGILRIYCSAEYNFNGSGCSQYYSTHTKDLGSQELIERRLGKSRGFHHNGLYNEALQLIIFDFQLGNSGKVLAEEVNDLSVQFWGIHDEASNDSGKFQNNC
ncbi:hypothetical protein O181_086550 [Austropuccinia psidii MF-1]|uniref:Uncharacterized protein n=1 Tax=Austropuccinia psidii MF-1 TaxID=1389203 RepID=A0A9Q3INB8_9BASI|nr:hypothetical protein [Austropuccinia psidii MF-1]